MLATDTVTSSDPVEGSPLSFYSHAITPVLLNAGTTYHIAEDVGSNNAIQFSAVGLTTNSAITYDGPVSSVGGGGTPVAAGIARGRRKRS